MILSVKLRSYSQIHPGMEQSLSGILNKRCWNFIPGTTIYGAMIKLFIDFFCNSDEETYNNCYITELLKGIKNSEFRISPFIPSEKPVESSIYNAVFYNDLAKKLENIKNLLTVSVHTAINEKGTAEESLLYSLMVHNPFRDYYGFIKIPYGLDMTEKLLSLLPLAPFGGKGSQAMVEGKVLDVFTEEEFLKGFEATNKIKSLTPLPVNKDTNDLINSCTKYQLKGRRYIKLWKNGIYLKRVKGNPEPELKPFKGYDSVNVIDGAFETKDNVYNGNTFINGLGDPCHTYLGLGQVIFE